MLALVLQKQADVLVQVKGNQPTLLTACEDLARYCTAAEYDVQHDKGHGRIETRTVRTCGVPANCLRATSDRSVTLELRRNVLNFEHLRCCACGMRN